MLPWRVPGDVGRPREALALDARSGQGAGRRPAPRPAAAAAPPPAGGLGLDDRNAGRQRSEPRGRHRHRFRLAAQNHLHAAVRVELDDLRRHLIDDPDVVLRIDAHLLRLQEAVDALADLAHELARAIELEQPRLRRARPRAPCRS